MLTDDAGRGGTLSTRVDQVTRDRVLAHCRDHQITPSDLLRELLEGPLPVLGTAAARQAEQDLSSLTELLAKRLLTEMPQPLLEEALRALISSAPEGR